jgi:hypothetical protein
LPYLFHGETKKGGTDLRPPGPQTRSADHHKPFSQVDILASYAAKQLVLFL